MILGVVSNLSLPDCAARFAIFDCSGESETPPRFSFRMLLGAQLAMVPSIKIQFIVVNDKTANGIYLAARLDNYNTP